MRFDDGLTDTISIVATPDARVSMPLAWSELLVCDPHEFTLRTVPAIYAANGDRHAAIDAHPGRIDALLELADKQERDGQGDAPWPPHYKKVAGEAPRVAPSRARKPKVPVITIAMDAGFQSLGPFNRAFKATTGVTPTEYRRRNEARVGV